MPSALCSAAISSGVAGSGVYTRPAKNGYFSGRWIWVWQSQAPAGTSKFTGVVGCDALAKAARFCTATPAAMEASRRSRRLSMGRLLFLLGLLSNYSAAAAALARAIAAGSPAARAAKKVMIAAINEQAARK